MKFSDMKSLALKAGVTALVALPLVAGAQPALPASSITGYDTLRDWVNTIGTWLFGLFLALVVIFIIYSAFLYLTSGGDEEKVKKAKNYLVYAIIGLAVALLTKGIMFLVGSFFGAATPTP